MTIDATIQRLTNDGETIAQFLVDTLQGNTRDATVSHRIKSAEWLAMFGRLIPESAIPKYASIRPRPKSEPKQAKTDKPDKSDKKPKVTEKQILHFDIARLIKQETNDGETIIEFLIRVISKIEETGENFTPAVRMRAAKELLIRGFGSTIPGVRRILSGKTEDLDSYLSKIVREYTNYGADSIRFLVETMENKDPEAESRGAASFIKLMRMRPRTKPAEGFTASHRVWAACELLRRAYDIRTDHITPEDIQAYWKSQTPAANPGRAAAGEQPAAAANIAAAEKRPHDRQPAANSDGAPAAESRAARRRQKRAARKAQKRNAVAEKRDAVAEKPATTTQKRDDAKQPAGDPGRAVNEQPAAATANITAAEKPAITTQKRDDHKQRDDAEKPADANPDGAPAAETRASRRRQKRAARKAEKSNAVAEKPASTTDMRDAIAEKPASATEKRNATTEKPDDAEKREDNRRNADNTPSALPGNLSRAARRREQRAARKAQKRNAANTSIGNPMPGAIHATDINENTVVFSHEPISPEELTRLRKSFAQPDDIPPNARSP